jgi:hypothetical protein
MIQKKSRFEIQKQKWRRFTIWERTCLAQVSEIWCAKGEREEWEDDDANPWRLKMIKDGYRWPPSFDERWVMATWRLREINDDWRLMTDDRQPTTDNLEESLWSCAQARARPTRSVLLIPTSAKDRNPPKTEIRPRQTSAPVSLISARGNSTRTPPPKRDRCPDSMRVTRIEPILNQPTNEWFGALEPTSAKDRDPPKTDIGPGATDKC